MSQGSGATITVFHCINGLAEEDLAGSPGAQGLVWKFVKLPCSGMVKDIFLLRAFEAGADAVVVLVCPEGACRHAEGNLRAKKRVQWVRGLLDRIGIDGRRLALYNVAPGDESAAREIVRSSRAMLAELGSNPAA
jgi:coenzyme F420-reducing hydrogenase delta subunit